MPGPGEDPRRIALIVATSVYQEQTLAHLRAPGTDARALAEVLADERIGGFEVQTFLNTGHDQLMRGVLEVCGSTGPGDFLLVYLSCHGVMDDRGRLYYATTDTERRLLAATAVSANWLNEQLEDCRARRQVLLLDCCHSGAFAKGSKGATGNSPLALQEQFPGRGKVVLTASRATEYSFEGENVVGQGVSSVFTRAIVDGLRSGEADIDSDGDVTVTDLYQYVFDRVRQAESRQTPGMWTYGSEGELLVAHSVREVLPAELPEDLVHVLANRRPRVRASAVAELADLLDKGPPNVSLAAGIELRRMAEEEVASVAELARTALHTAGGGSGEAVRSRIERQDAAEIATAPVDGAAERGEQPAEPVPEEPTRPVEQPAEPVPEEPTPPVEQPTELMEVFPPTETPAPVADGPRDAGSGTGRSPHHAARPACLVAAGGLVVLAGTSRLLRELYGWEPFDSRMMSIHVFNALLVTAQILVIAAGLPFRSAAGRWLLWGAVVTSALVWTVTVINGYTPFDAYAPVYRVLYGFHALFGLAAAYWLASSRQAVPGLRWLLVALYGPQALRAVLAPVGIDDFFTVFSVVLILAGVVFVVSGAGETRADGRKHRGRADG